MRTVRKGWVKCLCAFFCVLLINVGVWGCVLSAIYYGNIAQPEIFYESSFCWRVTDEYRDKAMQIADWSLEEDLSNYNQQRLEELQKELDSEQTNFCYICYTPDGTVLCSNVVGNGWKKVVYDVYDYSTSDWHADNVPMTSSNEDVAGSYWDTEGSYVTKYTIEYGVKAPLIIEDDYWQARSQMEWLNSWMPVFLGGSIALIVAGLILLVLLFCGAGRRPGREEVVLNWHDKIPYDLYLAVQVVANALVWGLSLVEGIWYLSYNEDLAGLVWVAATGLGGSILILAFLLTTVSRIKARTIFRNTIIWRLLAWLLGLVKKLFAAVKRCGNALSRAVHTLPMVWRIVVLFLIYLAGALLTAVLLIVGIVWFFYDGWAVLLTLLMIVAVPAWHGFALYLICRWALQWRRIREATQAVVAGQTEVQIDTEKYYPDLKEHAEQLNGLGLAIDNAVGERMKSERFKSELITNVSHDLKTPLTSIINYVDLLKKEEIENSTAREYIEVLDRKSQRLKKLTEDLVEASKASTGALTVTKERLDVVQLIRQALGEYEEKLANAGLLLVTKLPETPVYINADGRHVWRVLDNLLNNCAKYALEGTRVYLDAVTEERNVVITVKNISRQELNVPPEQLVERFVRGDESRTTEGSGLGLSIARSLVDLQGGQFGLDIDGDLFKAKVVLPRADA